MTRTARREPRTPKNTKSQKTLIAAMKRIGKADRYLRQIHLKFGPGRNTSIQCAGPVANEGRSELKQLVASLFGTNPHKRLLSLERLKHVFSGGVISKSAESLLDQRMEEGIITQEQYNQMMSLSHQVKRAAPSPPQQPHFPLTTIIPPAVLIEPSIAASLHPVPSPPPPPPSPPHSKSRLTTNLITGWSHEVQVVVESKDMGQMAKLLKKYKERKLIYTSKRQSGTLNEIYLLTQIFFKGSDYT